MEHGGLQGWQVAQVEAVAVTFNDVALANEAPCLRFRRYLAIPGTIKRIERAENERTQTQFDVRLYLRFRVFKP